MPNPSEPPQAGDLGHAAGARKLGIKEGFRVFVAGAPDGLRRTWLEPLPASVRFTSGLDAFGLDMAHVFSARAAGSRPLRSQVGSRKEAGGPTPWSGSSWPKKAAKVPSDVTEDTVRALALPPGLRRRQGLRGRRNLVRPEAGGPPASSGRRHEPPERTVSVVRRSTAMRRVRYRTERTRSFDYPASSAMRPRRRRVDCADLAIHPNRESRTNHDQRASNHAATRRGPVPVHGRRQRRRRSPRAGGRP